MIFKNIDWNNIWWSTAIFLISWHLIVLIGLPVYLYFRTPSLGLIIVTIVLLFLTGMSITAGYHRMYTHRAFKANKAGEILLLFFGTISMQSSVAYWAHKHRLHHTHVDKEGDPYNIQKGFWNAHILWLFKKQIPLDWSVIKDIKENKLTYFQHKYYNRLNFSLNILIVLILGWIFNDYWGAFIIGWATRVLVLSHSTYFVNSLAHMWGDKSYSREQSAVNNAIVALLTFGEGYHNYHHVFSSDYRNGVRWWQYDPTKWSIWLLSKFGLVSDLKTIDHYVARERMITEDKKIFLEALQKTVSIEKQSLQQKVSDLYESLSIKIANVKNLIEEYREARKENSKNQKVKHLKTRIKEAQVNMKLGWNNWLNLGWKISKVAPMEHHHV